MPIYCCTRSRKKWEVLQGTAMQVHPARSSSLASSSSRLPGFAPAENGGGAVGHSAVRQDQCVDVLLVRPGVGAVDDELIEGVGGLGAHAPQNAETVVHSGVPSRKSLAGLGDASSAPFGGTFP